MSQNRQNIDQAWNDEYGNSQFLRRDSKPQGIVRTWLKQLRKEKAIEGATIIDIGCGDGRTSLFLDERGAKVYGIDISKQALEQAKQTPSSVTWLNQSAAQPLPVQDNSVDTVFDVMGSLTLTSPERILYIQELQRVLKPGGRIFLRTLCKHDTYIKKQLSERPGKELNTYIHPTLRVQETVFDEQSLKETYKPFTCLSLETQTHFQRIENQIWKRKYLIAVFGK